MIRFLIMLGFFGRISDAALENLIESVENDTLARDNATR